MFNNSICLIKTSWFLKSTLNNTYMKLQTWNYQHVFVVFFFLLEPFFAQYSPNLTVTIPRQKATPPLKMSLKQLRGLWVIRNLHTHLNTFSYIHLNLPTHNNEKNYTNQYITMTLTKTKYRITRKKIIWIIFFWGLLKQIPCCPTLFFF